MRGERVKEKKETEIEWRVREWGGKEVMKKEGIKMQYHWFTLI